MRPKYRPIERCEGLDRETFEREYLAKGRPVVIPRCDADWCERWSFDALRDRHGDRPIDAEDTSAVYVGERVNVRTSVRRVCELVEAGDRTLRWRGLHFDLDHDPPPTDAFLPRATSSRRRIFWIAPKGTMSSLHHDGDADNVNLQVSGRKLFVLIAPRFLRDVYLAGTAESPINPFRPDLQRFPRFAGVDAVEADLRPGDALFVPKYWFHCVYTAAPSVNVNTWFDWEGQTSAWRALSGAPPAYRVLASMSAAMKRRGLGALSRAGGLVWRRLARPVAAEPRSELLDA